MITLELEALQPMTQSVFRMSLFPPGEIFSWVVRFYQSFYTWAFPMPFYTLSFISFVPIDIDEKLIQDKKLEL